MTRGSVDDESDAAAAAVARVGAYGGAVACEEFETAVARLEDDGELTPRERAVLSTLAARIVAGVLPGQRALREADVDAASVRELFAD